mmetsp:Transcript_9290/g.21969  ORF Transcript_9290/g.21969 Transcript_9290/m.21969 type:complete len:134 (+) Transcript_9290:395-796(+)
MSMQLTATEFDNEREKIKDAIAAAADVSSGRVRIKGSLIKPGGAAEVDMGVDALNKDDADLLAARLTATAINNIMRERELSEVTVMEAGSSAERDADVVADDQFNEESGASTVVAPIFAAAMFAMASSLRAVC